MQGTCPRPHSGQCHEQKAKSRNQNQTLRSDSGAGLNRRVSLLERSGQRTAPQEEASAESPSRPSVRAK